MVVDEKPVNTLEALGNNISFALLDKYPDVLRVRLTLKKPEASFAFVTFLHFTLQFSNPFSYHLDQVGRARRVPGPDDDAVARGL